MAGARIFGRANDKSFVARMGPAASARYRLHETRRRICSSKLWAAMRRPPRSRFS